MAYRTTTKGRRIKILQKKLDAVAIHQLREEVAALSKQLKQSEDARIYAEDIADFWREQVMQINEEMSGSDCTLSITQQGEIHVMRAAHD